MPELNVKESQVGDITVLRLDGKITIGEGSVMFRNVVNRLAINGRKQKFILDLGGVSYIDSSGGGELVAAFTTISRCGGLLVLCNLTQKMIDLLTITKLLTVYTVTKSLDEAIAGVLHDTYGVCPFYRCNNLIILPGPPVKNITCAFCGTEISFEPLSGQSPDANQLAITSLRVSTYEDEYLRIDGVAPSLVRINGRLDLFASEVVERAWYTIPAPRRVVFDINSAVEVSKAGLRTLLNLCASPEEGRAAVLGSGANDEVLPPDAPVMHKRQEAAIESLGSLPEGVKWRLTFGSFESLQAGVSNPL